VELQQAAEAAPAVLASPGDVVTVVDVVEQNVTPPSPAGAAAGAIQQGTLDVSGTIGDLTVQSGISSTVSNTTPESQGVSSVIQASGIIRIIFRRP
jgi:hypothetical protein